MIEEEEYIFELEDKTPITKPQQETEQEYIFELPQQEEITAEEEESICVINECDSKCNTQNEYFTIENLFSELTDDYKRAIARTNLGIADSLNLTWGNISGNLINQVDLYNFVKDSIKQSNQDLIDSLNLNLGDWAKGILDKLNLKADIYSPHFTGEPTTTLASLLDNSDRIASTKWVNAVISELLTGNEVKIEINPQYIYYGDNPQDITVTWQYFQDVTSQSINGITLGANVRTYTFTNISEAFRITLRYTNASGTYTKSKVVEIKFPIYYGTDNRQMQKTGESKFSINAEDNQFIYILLPSDDYIAVNNIIGGFTLLQTQIINSCQYYLYRSVNTNLGLCNIDIIKQY